MAKIHVITDQEYLELQSAFKRNQNKRTDKRIQALMLRYEGMSDAEISKKLGFNRQYVSRLCADFKKQGTKEFTRHKYGGNHRSMKPEEEAEILETFKKKAEAGHRVITADIKRAFDAKLGRTTGRSYIYMLLERVGWRKGGIGVEKH
jgi:transposase